MAAHQHWRLNITANNGDTFNVQIEEIEFRATVGGADQANGGTASASSVASTFVAANAFNNNTSTTPWISNTGPPAWIAYQFTAPVDVVQVAISLNTTSTTRAPRNFDVQYSDDGSTWVTRWSVTNVTGWLTSNHTRLFTDAVSVNKVHGFAVLSPSPASVAVVKAHGYAVLHDTAVGPIPETPVVTTRRRPLVAFLG